MKARSILLDSGFVAAVVDGTDADHDAARLVYAGLLDDYQAGAARLWALSTVLRGLPREVRRGALAPVETMWAARQHRTAAAHTDAPSFDIALTLAVARRERCAAIATTNPYYAQFDLDVLLATAAHPSTDRVGDQVPDGDVSFETEPLPALRSTAE